MEVVNFDEYVKQTKEANAEKQKDIEELLERAKALVRKTLKKLFDSREVGIPHPIQSFSSMSLGQVTYNEMFDSLINEYSDVQWYVNEDRIIEECKDCAVSEVIKEYNFANFSSDYGLTSNRNQTIGAGIGISFVLFKKGPKDLEKV